MFEFPWLKVLPYKGVLILICDWTLSKLECFQLEYCWLCGELWGLLVLQQVWCWDWSQINWGPAAAGLQTAVLQQVVEADEIVPRSETGSLTCCNNQQTSRVTPDSTHRSEDPTTTSNHTQRETWNNDAAKRTVRLMGNFMTIPYVVIIWARGNHGQPGFSFAKFEKSKKR